MIHVLFYSKLFILHIHVQILVIWAQFQTRFHAPPNHPRFSAVATHVKGNLRIMMHETAGLNTYLDDYIMNCQCVAGASLQASSVWCAVLLSFISTCTCFSIPVTKVTLASS